MKLILARTKAEAYPMCFGDKYLDILPDDLFGHANCNLVVVGNFWARPDFKAEEIYFYCKTHNITMPSELASMVETIL